ncbi:MAG: tail fiber domain-containing protein [Acidobacteria bacterium]|nr:tail fiber domain-containing protein [Acidobacteriota bacterium]MCB9397193.1 tail fiber domain-containing protein [Acidobacteriota bacterium]
MLMLFVFCFWQSEEVGSSQVLIVPLPSSLQVYDSDWFEISYRAAPEGPELFYEPAERVWLLQGQALLILGASGYVLPPEVTQRAVVYAHCVGPENAALDIEIFPRRDGVFLNRDPAALIDKLSPQLAGIDVSYLAQVAHFLAGNLATLDVMGTSYSVSGQGTVINASGQWVGGSIATVSGTNSVFIGSGAGSMDDGSANKNTAVGLNALATNVNGEENVAVGRGAMAVGSGGNRNVGLGVDALAQNSGQFNVAVGAESLKVNTTGSGNVGIGEKALSANVDGSNNVAIGQSALATNTSSQDNIAIGYLALMATGTFASQNVAIGSYAGQNNSGSGNIAVGYEALKNNNGTANTAIGTYSLQSNTSGNNNTSLGANTLNSNLIGNGNTAIGDSTLTFQLGSGATALGHEAALHNTVSETTALGKGALYSNTTGTANTAVGYLALESIETTAHNTAVGNRSLGSATSVACTALGSGAGSNVSSGNWNTLIGHNANVSDGTFSNCTALGDAAVATASNQVRIGDSGVTSIGGAVGWSVLSDQRFKCQVRENVPGLAFIRGLRPVTYQLDRQAAEAFISGKAASSGKTMPDSSRQSGFIAQEVSELAQTLGFNFSGVDRPTNAETPYALRYDQFVVPLVKAIQEQDQVIQTLEKRIQALERQIQNNP